MNRTKIGLFLIILPLLSGCSIHGKKYWNTQYKAMEACRSNWTYDFLQEEKEIRVLFFSKGSGYCTAKCSNFVIGVTANSDTIGISDINFIEELETNDTILVSPIDTTSQILNLLSPPMFTVYKEAKNNKLHCSVDKVYYAEIRKK